MVETNLLCYGELLMRLQPLSGHRLEQSNQLEFYVGGAEANVGILCSRLGLQVSYMTILPENNIGKMMLKRITQHLVRDAGTLFTGKKAGLYFFEDGNGIRNSEVIYDREDSSFAKHIVESNYWESVLKNISHLHWSGISPAVSAVAAANLRTLLQKAQEKSLFISADLNYRSTLWNYGTSPSDLMPGLLQYCHCMVVDFDAVEKYYGFSTQNKTDFEKRFDEVCTFLIQKNTKLEYIGMTYRFKENNVLHYRAALYKKGKTVYSKTYPIPNTIDPIGTGDAFTGGLLSGILKNESLENTIEKATICGVLKQSIRGDVALIDQNDIEHYLKQGTSTGIKR